jgi:hypothetical protein
MIPAQWERLPDELRYVPKWCVAAPDKSPYTTSGHRASVTNPNNWTDWYSASLTAAQWGNGAGIGFVLSEDDDFTCIDLDVKDTTTPEQLERFWKIVQAFDSYTELSRSGKGLHIWIRGKVGTGCRRDGVEVYSQQRFIICTGDAVLNKPVEHRQELLDILVAEIRAAAQTNHVELVEQDETETDEALWQKASEAANGDKFKHLWTGDWQGLGYPSQSEADLSLLSMLCFYSKSNEQVRRLFRMSGLGQRDKAQKDNRYIDRTLAMIRGRQQREEATAAAALANAAALVERAAVTVAPAKAPIVVESALDWPPGLLGELARWFYVIAPRPVKEVAIVSALGVAAGMFGRAYNVSGSGLNLYIVLVARSAIGKEAMHSSISKLCHLMLSSGAPAFSKFIDFADYASGPALVKAISSDERLGSFVNVAGEWGRKLRKMSDDHTEGPMSSLRTVMTNLYQKSSAGTIVGGIGYSDKEKSIASVNGVAYSMIGETTPDTFYESLTNTMMQDGFMSRFIVIEYGGLRPELNTATSATLSDEVHNTLINAAQEVLTCPPGGYRDVTLSRPAQDMLDAFDKHCDKEINSTDDESWRQMWNRAHLKALKVAGLLAVCDNFSTPIVTEDHAEWALNLIHSDIKIMRRKMHEGDVGDGDIVRERKMLAVLAEYLQHPITPGYKLPDTMRTAGVVARKYLQIRLQRTNSFVRHKLGQTAAMDLTIRSLVDSGYLVEVSKDKAREQWGAIGKAYQIVSLPDAP